jgi:hypothetical protein
VINPFSSGTVPKSPIGPMNRTHGNAMEKNWKMCRFPDSFPEHDIVRGDILDYAVEVEWFDLHLQRMLAYLEEIGELENTIVIVTSDNGMPFPRAKANSYEYGVHVPFAVRFPKDFPGAGSLTIPMSFADLAPTMLELTGTNQEGMLPISGKSITHILKSEKEGSCGRKQEIRFCRTGAPLGFPLPEPGLPSAGHSQQRFPVDLESQTRTLACRSPSAPGARNRGSVIPPVWH